MRVYLLVLAVCGMAAAAPQNWPYRDSLMPYRYGYPSQTQYKYLPQIEDDEDVGPYLSPGVGRHDVAVGRQDVVVGSDGDRVRPTPDSSVPGVVETGSVAPVVEPTKAPVPVVPQPTRVPGPPAPIGGNRPVQPPVFPPARPPPTPAPVEQEEDEEDDESDEEANADPEADDEADVEEGGDDEEPSPDDDDNEEEEEEERRRQVPLNSDETVEVAPVVPVVDKVKPVVVAPQAPAPVVVAPVNNSKVPPVVPENSVEDVQPAQAVESNEVVRPDSDDDSSEEQGLGDGVEALVPGYVTEQGEVLVPVDTVSGDQPISIVPDPYSQPARGIPIRGAHSFQSHYDDIVYSNPYYYSEELYDEVGRQDDSDETEVLDAEPIPVNAGNNADEDKPSNENTDDENPEGRNEFFTDFPPARTPELYALINPRVSAQGYLAQQYQQQQYQGYQGQGFQVPYASQGAPIIYRVRPQQSNPSVSLAIRVNGGNGNNNNYNPDVNQFVSQQQQQYVDNEQFGGPEPVLRGPYSPNYNRPPNRPYAYNPYVGYRQKPQYAPRPQYVPRPYYPRPSPYGPRPIYGGRPGYSSPEPIRPVFRPSYSEGPVYIKRRPIAASISPVSLKTKQPIALQSFQYSKFGPVKFVPSKRRPPTPVDYQDDDLPYPFVNPFGPSPPGYEPVPAADNSASDSVEEPKKVVPVANKAPVVPAKSRRAAKMAKKTSKKDLEKKKKLTDPDPLNILKKISMKRS